MSENNSATSALVAAIVSALIGGTCSYTIATNTAKKVLDEEMEVGHVLTAHVAHRFFSIMEIGIKRGGEQIVPGKFLDCRRLRFKNQHFDKGYRAVVADLKEDLSSLLTNRLISKRKTGHVGMIASIQNLIVQEVEYGEEGLSMCLVYEMCRFNLHKSGHISYMNNRRRIYIDSICAVNEAMDHENAWESFEETEKSLNAIQEVFDIERDKRTGIEPFRREVGKVLKQQWK